VLWACVLLPRLALDDVLRRHPDPERPIALVTGPAQKRVLHDCNAAAHAAGLYPGQGLLAAQALLPVFATI
jgi:protein ImuB